MTNSGENQKVSALLEYIRSQLLGDKSNTRLAQVLGLNRTTLVRWRRGESSKLSRSNLAMVAERLNVSEPELEDFFSGRINEQEFLHKIQIRLTEESSPDPTTGQVISQNPKTRQILKLLPEIPLSDLLLVIETSVSSLSGYFNQVIEGKTVALVDLVNLLKSPVSMYGNKKTQNLTLAELVTKECLRRAWSLEQLANEVGLQLGRVQAIVAGDEADADDLISLATVLTKDSGGLWHPNELMMLAGYVTNDGQSDSDNDNDTDILIV